jgi:hypothetical protein
MDLPPTSDWAAGVVAGYLAGLDDFFLPADDYDLETLAHYLRDRPLVGVRHARVGEILP